MTLSMHLRIVGILLVLLGLSHSFFNRYFGWERELADVSLLTRQIFFAHSFFIGLGVVLGGVGSFLCADALLRPALLSRAVLAGMTVFGYADCWRSSSLTTRASGKATDFAR